MILEVNLNDFVRETEHNCMPCSHPLFNVDDIFHLSFRDFLTWNYLSRLICFWFLTAFKVASEMLKQSYFFLQLFWILRQIIFFSYILTICTSSLIIVEMITVRIKNNFCWIIEVYASCLIWKIISKAVLWRIINPFFDPNFSVFEIHRKRALLLRT